MAENGRAPWLIAIAASAGGIAAIRTILAALPSDWPVATVVVQHRPPDRNDSLAAVLGRGTSWTVRVASPGETIQPRQVYLARGDSHLTVTPEHTFRYRDGAKIRYSRSSANPLLESAAKVFGTRVIAIVLTGCGRDATNGVQEVKAHGGVVIAQDRATAEFWPMPQSAIASGAVDYVLPLELIAPALLRIVTGSEARATTEAECHEPDA